MSQIHSVLPNTQNGQRQSRPVLPGAQDLTLATGRVHEACGPARARFALWLAAQGLGPVVWIAPSWLPDALAPCGVRAIVDPGRLLLVRPHRPLDVLWSLEETLRSGAVSLAVAELPQLPNLTQVRRLHLAAETGARGRAGPAPMGLLLTEGRGGAAGVETRWHLAPGHAAQGASDRLSWRLERRRARMAPPAAWSVCQDAGQAEPPVVAPARPGDIV